MVDVFREESDRSVSHDEMRSPDVGAVEPTGNPFHEPCATKVYRRSQSLRMTGPPQRSRDGRFEDVNWVCGTRSPRSMARIIEVVLHRVDFTDQDRIACPVGNLRDGDIAGL